jgi:predicted ATP-dependent endonuclease of OLD family
VLELNHIQAYNFGQIKEAGIELGDFMVLLGLQASVKSTLLPAKILSLF